jgi:CRISPR-associated protein Cmr1
MPVTISRFYKREKLELDCEIITPMFLGNASQEAELRAAPFKGLLRYWWRVAEGAQFADHTELLAAENKLFGSPDEKCGGQEPSNAGGLHHCRCGIFSSQDYPIN